jgi:HK97 gp10 family phage protein
MKSKWKGKEYARRVKEAKKTALEAAAIFIEGEMIARCPVDTGYLRSTIGHKIKPKEAQVGPGAEYAKHVEFGTVKSAEQPFVRPALDENKRRIKKVYKEVLRKSINTKQGGK